jgi:xylulokinase
MDYVIGCDIGSQGTKAVLVSLEGEIIAEAVQSYGIDYPQPLWAEQPAERWLEAVSGAVREALRLAQVNPAQVQAIGTAAQVDGVVPVDRAGRALRPAIIWMDRRAGEQCARAGQAVDAEALFARTGLNLDPTHVAPKIRWIADQHPGVAERAAYYLLPGSFVTHYLTGELAVDYSNASSTLLLDVSTRQWAPDLCALFGVEASRLARVCAATEVAGNLRPAAAEALGLAPGTRVVVGSGDEHAACLGAGVVVPGRVGDIAGTAEPVCAASRAPLFDDTHLVETHCHADPDQWLLENPGFVSGGNFRWYRDHFGAAEVAAGAQAGRSAYQLLDEQASAVPPGSEGLVFLPCLMGAMTPTWNEHVRGTFAGLTLAHTRAHMTRSILEGSAYAVRDIVDRMRALGLPLAELRVVGGGARSALWNQIKADVIGLPVVVPNTTETTALGGALLALVGIGAYGSLLEASDHIVRPAQRFEPNEQQRPAYEQPYQLYRDTYFALAPVFERAARQT